MRNFVLLSILSFLMTFAAAQSSPEEYVEVFFKEIAKANFEKALDLMPISNKLESDTSFITQVRIKLEKSSAELGKYCGYELITSEEVTPSFITYTYFIKYQEAPVRIQFVFYKPLESWQLNRINLTPTASQRTASRQKFKL